jgi:hypothetical protein
MKTGGVGGEQILILVAAMFHGPPPAHGDRVHANCERVLRHALRAAGVWDDELQRDAWGAFQGVEEDLARFPVIGAWYSTLIELVMREPESERLLAKHPDWEGRLR